MHRNAALLHKQHRNDSCESRLYISFLCKWKFVCVVEQILNASVYFTHMESFFFFYSLVHCYTQTTGCPFGI